MSTHYCTSCRKDMEDCHCATTLGWRERASARREREAHEAAVAAAVAAAPVEGDDVPNTCAWCGSVLADADRAADLVEGCLRCQ